MDFIIFNSSFFLLRCFKWERERDNFLSNYPKCTWYVDKIYTHTLIYFETLKEKFTGKIKQARKNKSFYPDELTGMIFTVITKKLTFFSIFFRFWTLYIIIDWWITHTKCNISRFRILSLSNTTSINWWITYKWWIWSSYCYW